jgi:hypothetical protein
VQTQSAVAGDIPQTFAQAIAKVENVDLEANGIAMNPLDYWAGVSTRFSTSLDADAAGFRPLRDAGPHPVGPPGDPHPGARLLGWRGDRQGDRR